MAAQLVRKVPPRPSACASAVLLTKQDFEDLRMQALMPSKELPRCLPMQPVAVARSITPNRGASKSLAGGFMGALPAPQRRTRSASTRQRPSSLPAQPGDSGDPVRKMSKVVRMQQLPGPRGSVAGAGGAAAVGAAAANGGSASGPRGPAAAVGAASGAGPSMGGAGAGMGLGLELCGFDPRKAPKVPTGHVAGPAFPAAPGVARQQVPADPLRVVANAPPSLAVSGQAAAVAVPVVVINDSPPDPALLELQPEDLYSDDDEEEEGTGATGSDGEAFDYRNYRYAGSQAVKSKAAQDQQPPLPPYRRRQQRRAAPREMVAADSDDDTAPWGSGREHLPPPLHWWSETCPSTSSTPHCEEERPEDEQLKRIADTLVRFYGLPGGQRAVRFRRDVSNVAIVEEAAWAQRQRESQLDEPPMLWVRGGRIYDFHGDRGTLAEFEHDLLTRQVEDDSICRLRRKEQGLLPFPFLALPIRRASDEASDEPESQGNSRDGARRGHGP